MKARTGGTERRGGARSASGRAWPGRLLARTRARRAAGHSGSYASSVVIAIAAFSVR
jgi:hypothetical protein